MYYQEKSELDDKIPKMSEEERDRWLKDLLPKKLAFVQKSQARTTADLSPMIREVQRQIVEVRDKWIITKAGDLHFGLEDSWDD